MTSETHQDKGDEEDKEDLTNDIPSEHPGTDILPNLTPELTLLEGLSTNRDPQSYENEGLCQRTVPKEGRSAK